MRRRRMRRRMRSERMGEAIGANETNGRDEDGCEATYAVAEIFLSINGEGRRAGQLACFVRFTGCNLVCTYCDTMWANVPDAPHTAMTVHEIVERVKTTGAKNVTVTGGEPLLQENLSELLQILHEEGFFVEIETAGAESIEPYADAPWRPSFTLDYKLPGSGMESYMYGKNFEIADRRDTVKFVCGSIEDMMRAREVCARYGLEERTHVYLSPVFGRIAPVDMVNYMAETFWTGVTLQLQMHKFIWDPNARGV